MIKWLRAWFGSKAALYIQLREQDIIIMELQDKIKRLEAGKYGEQNQTDSQE